MEMEEEAANLKREAEDEFSDNCIGKSQILHNPTDMSNVHGPSQPNHKQEAYDFTDNCIGKSQILHNPTDMSIVQR